MGRAAASTGRAMGWHSRPSTSPTRRITRTSRRRSSAPGRPTRARPSTRSRRSEASRGGQARRMNEIGPILPAHAGERAAGRIGLGLAALGRPGYLNVGHGSDLGSDRSPDALRRRAEALLDDAYSAGVRYLDAARSYGRGEAFLAAWLDARRPHDAVVGSKWGYVYTANWTVDGDPPEVKHHDVDTLRRQLEESR